MYPTCQMTCLLTVTGCYNVLIELNHSIKSLISFLDVIYLAVTEIALPPRRTEYFSGALSVAGLEAGLYLGCVGSNRSKNCWTSVGVVEYDNVRLRESSFTAQIQEFNRFQPLEGYYESVNTASWKIGKVMEKSLKALESYNLMKFGYNASADEMELQNSNMEPNKSHIMDDKESKTENNCPQVHFNNKSLQYIFVIYFSRFCI